jgi:very-short-patch-repair endonuclease
MSRVDTYLCQYCGRRRPNSGSKFCLQCINKNIKNTGIGTIVTGSYGEQMLRKTLDHLRIKYKTEHIFDDLRMHRYDFYIPDLRLVVEYDGEPHFSQIIRYHNKPGSFEKQQLSDKTKTLYIKNKIGYMLLRIDYTWLQNAKAVESSLRYCMISQMINTNCTSNIVAMKTEMYSYMKISDSLVSINYIIGSVNNSVEYISFIRLLSNRNYDDQDSGIEDNCLMRYQSGCGQNELSHRIRVAIDYNSMTFNEDSQNIDIFYIFLFSNPGLTVVEIALNSLGYMHNVDFLTNYIEPEISEDTPVYHFVLPREKLVIQLDNLTELLKISSKNVEDDRYHNYRTRNLTECIDSIFCRNFRLLRIAYDQNSTMKNQWAIKSVALIIRDALSDYHKDVVLFLTHREPYSMLINLISTAMIDLKLVRDTKFLHGQQYDVLQAVILEIVQNVSNFQNISTAYFFLPLQTIINNYQLTEPKNSIIPNILKKTKLKQNSNKLTIPSSDLTINTQLTTPSFIEANHLILAVNSDPTINHNSQVLSSMLNPTDHQTQGNYNKSFKLRIRK